MVAAAVSTAVVVLPSCFHTLGLHVYKHYPHWAPMSKSSTCIGPFGASGIGFCNFVLAVSIFFSIRLGPMYDSSFHYPNTYSGPPRLISCGPFSESPASLMEVPKIGTLRGRWASHGWGQVSTCVFQAGCDTYSCRRQRLANS